MAHTRPSPGDIFDTLSIGFGPASVALAIALAELNAHHPRPQSQPVYSSLGGLQHALGFDAQQVAGEQRKNSGVEGRKVKAAFVERYNGFRWHPGMMLEGSKMQISFLKDLATLRNPQSPYTFLSYLASFQPSRLVSFISLSTFTPSRREFADYLTWCAEKVTAEIRAQGGEVSFGEEVVGVDALRPDEHDEGADVRVLRVTSRVLETNEFVHRYTRNLVVSAGGSPKVPPQLAAPELVQTGRVLHTASFLEHIDRVLPEVVEHAEERPIRLAVIGAGQSAAECFLHLRTKLAPLLPSFLTHRPQIDMLIRSSALRPTDEGQFSNEVFDPSMSQAVYRLGEKERERVLGEAKGTNYSIVNPRTLEAVYETMYDQKVEEDVAVRTGSPASSLTRDPHLNIRPYTEIREARPTPSGAIELVLFNPITREERSVTYDAVVCGTGYDRQAWRRLLFPPESALESLEGETIPLAALFDTDADDSPASSSSIPESRLAAGVAADVGHCNTPSTCVGYGPENDGLKKALEGAEIIIIPAGMPRKPGMTRDDLFNANASIVRDLAQAAAEVAPKARIGIIANPVNSTVPIVAEVFKKAGVYDPKRLFGVTTLDIVRASAFLSGIAGTEPKDTNVPVVGGHSGPTIVPLLSQLPAGKKVVEQGGETLAALVKRIQYGGDEVVKAKDGAGSATLSMAYAGADFTDSLLRAMKGEKGVTLCTYVESPLYKDQGVEFFSSPVELSSEGTVAKIHPVGDLHPTEQKLLEACLPDLKKNIAAGVKFMSA